jgi:hypothetical protein
VFVCVLSDISTLQIFYETLILYGKRDNNNKKNPKCEVIKIYKSVIYYLYGAVAAAAAAPRIHTFLHRNNNTLDSFIRMHYSSCECVAGRISDALTWGFISNIWRKSVVGSDRRWKLVGKMGKPLQ